MQRSISQTALGSDAGYGAAPRGRSQPRRHHRIVIIGTGFSGLGAAIRLLQAGEDDILLLERADDVGGCWRDNTYPGVQCDVQSVVYSFSFAPNPGWTRDFSWGNEIHAYLRHCADRFGVLPHIRFGTQMLAARWDDGTRRWRIETSQGLYTAEILLTAHGALSAPKRPDIPGLETFAGPVFHSAQWCHDVTLKGKRVAVIGTGASAIQIVPSVQPDVEALHVYQRTPPWVLPRPDGPISATRRFLYKKVPLLQKLSRALRFVLLELRILGILTRPELMRFAEAAARRHLRAQVTDPGLRERLTPRYAIGCKRILLSNDFYPALTKPNVELITNRIREITADAVVTDDGAVRNVDAIVLCTGFRVADHPITHRIHGRDGRSIAQCWRQHAGAYLGMTVHGFPNLFLLSTGPHTGLGHNSIVYMIESQLEYVLGAIAALGKQGDAVLEVREEAVVAFTDEMQRKLEGTVWSSGCSSFYLDANGRNIAIWPDFAAAYRRRTRRFEPDKYTFSVAVPQVRVPPRARGPETGPGPARRDASVRVAEGPAG